jgi:hypothetical protein
VKLQAQIGQSMFGPHPATSLLCAGLIALSLNGCADTYYAETYYTPESRYNTYYGPDYYPYYPYYSDYGGAYYYGY